MREHNRLQASLQQPDSSVATALPSPQAFVMLPMPGAAGPASPWAFLQGLYQWAQAQAQAQLQASTTSQASLCRRDWLAVWN
jgi:hypothetical protein